MKREQIVQLIYGIVILTSLALGLWIHPGWLALAGLAGANLIQSALTGWCVLDMTIKKFFGVKSEAEGLYMQPPATHPDFIGTRGESK